jgi:hypothetical protein
VTRKPAKNKQYLITDKKSADFGSVYVLVDYGKKVRMRLPNDSNSTLVLYNPSYPSCVVRLVKAGRKGLNIGYHYSDLLETFLSEATLQENGFIKALMAWQKLKKN